MGKFRIKSDRNQFILYAERKKGTFPGKDAPGKNETVEEWIGYYSTLTSLFKALPSRMLMLSDATTLRQAVDELERYRELIDAALKGA